MLCCLQSLAKISTKGKVRILNFLQNQASSLHQGLKPSTSLKTYNHYAGHERVGYFREYYFVQLENLNRTFQIEASYKPKQTEGEFKGLQTRSQKALFFCIYCKSAETTWSHIFFKRMMHGVALLSCCSYIFFTIFDNI